MMAQQRPKAAELSAAAEDLQSRRQGPCLGVPPHRRQGRRESAHRRGLSQAGTHAAARAPGRKSGKVFVATLLYMFDGADVVIVASQGSAVVWTDREIPVVVLQPR